MPPTSLRYLDRCLRVFYRLQNSIRLEDYLVRHAAPPGRFGAVLVRHDENDFEIGVYLHPQVLAALQDFAPWKTATWNAEQLRALSVACEELSHFRYLCARAGEERAVSQLEIEVQGEVDRFFLIFWLLGRQNGFADSLYCQLLETFFYAFRLQAGLAGEERERYLEANRLARNFAVACRERALRADGGAGSGLDALGEELRRFYRLGLAEKILVATQRKAIG